jgi:hypothetical protein
MATIRSAQAGATGTDTSAPPAAAVIEGMLAGTMVMTMDGALPVEYLGPGDRVVTRRGAARVATVEVTVVENARVVRIAHDTLGVDMPHEDVTVAAAQPIAVQGWRAKALCGTDQAVLPASRLTDGEYIRAETLSEARFFKLTFAEPTLIYAGGLMLACNGAKVQA